MFDFPLCPVCGRTLNTNRIGFRIARKGFVVGKFCVRCKSCNSILIIRPELSNWVAGATWIGGIVAAWSSPRFGLAGQMLFIAFEIVMLIYLQFRLAFRFFKFDVLGFGEENECELIE